MYGGSVVTIVDEEYIWSRGWVLIFAEHSAKGWQLLGTTIDGENDSYYPWQLSTLSPDGTAVAVGEYNKDNNGTNYGHTWSFSYDVKTIYGSNEAILLARR